MQYLTAGESHGPMLTGILTGMPANVALNISAINQQLALRQNGYGRGGRMKIEQDTVQITAGMRAGQTTGSPIALLIQNRDYGHWQEIMGATARNPKGQRVVTRPRPGHADLVGGLKYDQQDLRNILERASARSTAMIVALGSIAGQLLAQLGIHAVGYVTGLGGQTLADTEWPTNMATLRAVVESNDMRLPDTSQVAAFHGAVDAAKAAHHTIGGQITVQVAGLIPGIGSMQNWRERLDGRLAGAIVSIPAIKAVSFGDGPALGEMAGNAAQDDITWTPQGGYTRASNHLGGFEGGMTNGQPLLIHATMKPIPTQPRGLPTVDIATHETVQAVNERADVTAVPAASLVAQAMVQLTLAQEITAQFSSATLADLRSSYQQFAQRMQDRRND
ncbi:chorismate synthase [Schleiferilactobacillus harbinensis]|uniref:Chorismate synthase n=1 Tax=Schleiferilactobacillus harbinensis TaxID=304207 RepID=A0A5P8M511_9LACO|nr:chorismate synthase [Schleiferilactobacillus harbinensis]MBO3091989.1 chorismate synthase [Schleiferilactobacillus harbinensis]QFR23563.1 chorismate synthase [Schleiferilactobacillus harbinensis]